MGLWKRYLRWRMRHVEMLELLADGFVSRSGGQSVAVRWNGIVRVAAFKRDLLTTDLLCLLVEHAGGIVELHEDAQGYRDVEAELERRLGLAPEWKLRVLFPAFATNATLLFPPDRAGLDVAPAG